MRAVLVGELNPYGADPKFALYPLPKGASGHRLCTMVMGLPMTDYMQNYIRVDLCTGQWSMCSARARAKNILKEYKDLPFVLLGRKVTRAFKLEYIPYYVYDLRPYNITGCVLPHPSGLNRIWHEPESIDKARAALRAVGAL